MAGEDVVAAEGVFGLEEGERGEDVGDVVRVFGGAEVERWACVWRLWVGGVGGEAVGEGNVASDMGCRRKGEIGVGV